MKPFNFGIDLGAAKPGEKVRQLSIFNRVVQMRVSKYFYENIVLHLSDRKTVKKVIFFEMVIRASSQFKTLVNNYATCYPTESQNNCIVCV